jgi:hypothetical protein
MSNNKKKMWVELLTPQQIEDFIETHIREYASEDTIDKIDRVNQDGIGIARDEGRFLYACELRDKLTRLVVQNITNPPDQSEEMKILSEQQL